MERALVGSGPYREVTPDGDIHPEKITNCDGQQGLGSSPARDLRPRCGRVHRFATIPDKDASRGWVSQSGPVKDAWEREAGRIAVEQGLVFLP